MDNEDTCNLRVPNDEDLNNVLHPYADGSNDGMYRYLNKVIDLLNIWRV